MQNWLTELSVSLGKSIWFERPARHIFDKRNRISLCHSFHLTLRFYFKVKIGIPKISNFTYQVSLPQGLTCSQCVVQQPYGLSTFYFCTKGEGGSSLFATPHKRTILKLSCLCECNIMYTAPYHELKYKCKNG